MEENSHCKKYVYNLGITFVSVNSLNWVQIV